mmetsp:Transcript_49472/g.116134  ORF Transcript_49472/g.116134 Transcript_49472/m.116134 type:complete len:200 (+) Transcript_49472:441-1040(+)
MSQLEHAARPLRRGVQRRNTTTVPFRRIVQDAFEVVWDGDVHGIAQRRDGRTRLVLARRQEPRDSGVGIGSEDKVHGYTHLTGDPASEAVAKSSRRDRYDHVPLTRTHPQITPEERHRLDEHTGDIERVDTNQIVLPRKRSIIEETLDDNVGSVAVCVVDLDRVDVGRLHVYHLPFLRLRHHPRRKQAKAIHGFPLWYT